MIRGAGGERVVGMEDFHVGPYMTAVGDGELLTEVRIPLRRGGGSAHEKVERRAGDWAIAAASAAVWIDGGRIADAGHRAQRRRAHDDPSHARRGAAARQGSVGRAVRAGGRDRLGRLLPERGRPGAGRLQAPSRRRPHETRPAPRDGTRAAPGGTDHARLDNGQRREGLPRDRAAPAARPLHSRDARPDRHPLGLRHLQLRRLRRPDGRQAGQVVHDPRRDVRGPRDPHGRVARGRRPAGPGPAWASTSGMRSSAASARPGC